MEKKVCFGNVYVLQDSAFILSSAVVWLLEGLSEHKGNLNDKKVATWSDRDHSGCIWIVDSWIMMEL